jgi:hypothetical protein
MLGLGGGGVQKQTTVRWVSQSESPPTSDKAMLSSILLPDSRSSCWDGLAGSAVLVVDR